MYEVNKSDSNTSEAKKSNRNPFSAAYPLFETLPVGLRRIIVGATICMLAVIAIAVFHPSLNERWKFGTDMALNALILLAITVQAYIYTKQWGAMAEGLEIERAKTNPRLRIVGVSAENFTAGARPVFIVTIANDGLLAATGVRIHMGVEIDADKELDWIHDPVVTIPASGKEHFFILSSSWLEQQHIDGFNNTVALKVVGYFDYGPAGRNEFCYKYLPWEGQRPEKIPQFVPCDFEPRLNTTIHLKGIEAKVTMGTVGVVIQKNPPEETPPQEKKRADGKDDQPAT